MISEIKKIRELVDYANKEDVAELLYIILFCNGAEFCTYQKMTCIEEKAEAILRKSRNRGLEDTN